MIPKLSPGTARRNTPSTLFGLNKAMSNSCGPLSPASQEISKSLIPRVATPPALRKMYPTDGSDKLAHPDRNVVRKNTYTKLSVGVPPVNPDLEDKEREMAAIGEKEEPAVAAPLLAVSML
jgi:hypothetical protein